MVVVLVASGWLAVLFISFWFAHVLWCLFWWWFGVGFVFDLMLFVGYLLMLKGVCFGVYCWVFGVGLTLMFGFV